MKKLVLNSLTLLFIFVWQMGWSQNTYWVSNRNDGVVVDFTNLNAAYEAANPGDTLVIYPSPSGYPGLYINKEIHLRGLGYRSDLTTQPSLGINTFSTGTSIGGLTLVGAASNGSVQSVKTGFIQGDNLSNYRIEKCEIVGLNFTNNCNGNYISRSYIDRTGYTVNGYCCAYYDVRFSNSSGENIIENCIFANGGANVETDMSSGNNVLANCILSEGLSINNSVLYNNISLHPLTSISGQFNDIYNNVFLGGAPGVDNHNNIHGASNVCVGYPMQGSYSFDSRWQLTPSSPARDAGVDGEDCGIFDGQYPYKLSGILDRPLIYELNGPLYVPEGSDLPLTIKVRAEN